MFPYSPKVVGSPSHFVLRAMLVVYISTDHLVLDLVYPQNKYSSTFLEESDFHFDLRGTNSFDADDCIINICRAIPDGYHLMNIGLPISVIM